MCTVVEYYTTPGAHSGTTNKRCATDQEIAQGYWVQQKWPSPPQYYFFVSPTLNITNVVATDKGLTGSGKHQVHIEVSATGAGSFRILLDGLEIWRQMNVNAGTGSSWGFDIYVLPGTYQICAEAI